MPSKTPEPPPSELELAAVARVAANDQSQADWIFDAECLAGYYKILRDAGMPENLITILAVNAQSNYFESQDAEDDDAD